MKEVNFYQWKEERATGPILGNYDEGFSLKSPNYTELLWSSGLLGSINTANDFPSFLP